jgi:hypothetical protein
MTKWDDNDFTDADDPLDVGWMISYWRIVPCDTGCKDGYSLQSRQFDHLPLTATRAEAIAEWRRYLRQKRRTGQHASIKGLTVFLTKVVKVGVVSDETGAMDTTRGDGEDSN